MRRLWTKASRAAATLRARPRTAVAAGLALVLAGGTLAWWAFPRARRDVPQPPVMVQTAARPTRVVGFEEGCLTAACHVPMKIAPTLHAPMAHGACDACHAPDTGGHTYPLRRARADLCTPCHDTGAGHAVQHGAMTDDGCLACHQPHGSDTRALLNRASVPETCVACHPRTEGLVRHAPYAADRCDLCHAPHGSSTRELLAAGTVTEACGTCHAALVARVESSTHSHAKAEGSCLACHSAHAAPAKGLLSGPPRETCVRCHADVGLAVGGAKVSHEPVLKGEQCTRCHDPHASDQPSMLRSTQATLCLSCHDRPVTAADGRQVASMAGLVGLPREDHAVPGHRECGGCHGVHGGTHERLLRDQNTKLPLGPYDARNFALCFSCHDAKLASSSNATRFRDGDRNLHEVHLQPGERSRGCAACHSVHAEGQPRLIGKTVNFEGSGWAMPMGFSVTAEGGRCGSGCHEAQEYSRKPGGARPTKNGGAP